MFSLRSKTIILLLALLSAVIGPRYVLAPASTVAGPGAGGSIIQAVMHPQVPLNGKGAPTPEQPTPAVAATAEEAVPADPPPPPAAPSPPVTKFAVIVGIVYQSNDIGVVQFADNDATNTYNMLVNQMGFPPQNVILLRDSQATRENIMNSLNWLHDNPAINANSEVVFFYSGHGLKNGVVANVPWIGDDSAIVPFDYANFDYHTGAGLIWDYEIAARLKDMHPARMWVAIDSCFSGGFLKPGITGPDRVVTVSSGANQLSNEIPWTQSGVMTQFLVDEAMSRVGQPVEQAFWYAFAKSGQFGQNPQIDDQYPGSLRLN